MCETRDDKVRERLSLREAAGGRLKVWHRRLEAGSRFWEGHRFAFKVRKVKAEVNSRRTGWRLPPLCR